MPKATQEELTCPECGFVAKNRAGLNGHRQFKHGVPPTSPQLPLEPQDRLVTESRLELLLDERFEQVKSAKAILTEQHSKLDELTGVVQKQQSKLNQLDKAFNDAAKLLLALNKELPTIRGQLLTMTGRLNKIETGSVTGRA